MEYFITEPTLGVYLEALGISAESARTLFSLLDTDKSGHIDIEEFSEGCQRIQGEAKSMDIHVLIYQIKQFLTKWNEFTEHADGHFDRMSRGMDNVRRQATGDFSSEERRRCSFNVDETLPSSRASPQERRSCAADEDESFDV